MIWPFRRAKPEPETIPDTRESWLSWKAGDLAVCISGWPADCPPPAPRIRDIARVTGVRDDVATHGTKVRAYFLTLDGFGDVGFNTGAFRKVVAADAAFTRQIRACKPARRRQPA